MNMDSKRCDERHQVLQRERDEVMLKLNSISKLLYGNGHKGMVVEHELNTDFRMKAEELIMSVNKKVFSMIAVNLFALIGIGAMIIFRLK